jgi:formylglycine-generating enzyme required for sulfatase activity
VPDAAEERDVSSGPDVLDASDGSDTSDAHDASDVTDAPEAPDVPQSVEPPSCALHPLCGPQNESCCASPLLPMGTFRVHNDPMWPRTVSAFRLDRFEVTIGRFRRFIAAADAGWRPPAGSGRHTHVPAGALQNMIGVTLESGWDDAWNSDFPKAGEWDQVDHLACPNSIWTATPGPNENKPVSCVTWYQAYAFCIWDGGFLPSYTERNYAATGGEQQRPYPWGSDPPDLSHAQYCPVFCDPYPPLLDVGSLSPLGDGRFGQADLAGNVWEWVLDTEVGTDTCKDCEFVDPAKDTRLDPGGGVDAKPGDLPTDVTYDDVRTYREFALGMRCARSPAP